MVNHPALCTTEGSLVVIKISIYLKYVTNVSE